METFHKLLLLVVVIGVVALSRPVPTPHAAPLLGESTSVHTIPAVAYEQNSKAEQALLAAQSSPAGGVPEGKPQLSGTSTAVLVAPHARETAPEVRTDGGAELKSVAAPVPPLFIRISATEPPALDAHSVLVADLEGGEVYYGVNPEKQWPIASITKLVSGALVMGRMKMDDVVAIDPERFDAATRATLTQFMSPVSYTVKDLLRFMLTISSNDAAEALAYAYGRERFLSDMNALGKEWGLASTHFYDPTGLSAANQSSAADLKIIAKRMYDEYPALLTMTRQPRATVAELGSSRRQTLANINEFAGTFGFLGGKTGYTEEAVGNLLSIFNVGGHPVAIIVLGTSDRFGGTRQLLAWFTHDYKPSR